MKTEKPGASNLEYDFYDDLSVIMDGRVGLSFDGSVESITLEINDKEIAITGAAADSIYEAIETRADSRREIRIALELEATIIERYENNLLDKMEG